MTSASTPPPPSNLPVSFPAIPLTWENAAERLVGTITVVEMRHYDAQKSLMRHDHVWGQVVSADRKNGVRIMVGGRTFAGKLLVLPIELDSFTKPKEGVWKLRTTGEEITDPNWFVTVDVNYPDQVKTVASKGSKPPPVKVKKAK